MAVIDQVKLDRIIDLLEKINFGSLTIVIHEGKITQLDVMKSIDSKNNKNRFEFLEYFKYKEYLLTCLKNIRSLKKRQT